MVDGDGPDGLLDAGEFGPWVGQMQDAIDGARASDVPCGACSACCTASQFVHIGPEETDTLAHVPAELLFAAPFLPPGHKVMGYDRAGRCPMLVDGRCSIYEHRPRTCRTYDCRIFAATGVAVAGDQPLIAERVARWQFSYGSRRSPRSDRGPRARNSARGAAGPPISPATERVGRPEASASSGCSL
ncbi:MAG: hypothetical protein NVS3B21_07820 [Acidimicrobiales bacterium]